jgi:F-type H+-transporting ATPase subunit epsilon
VLKLSILSPERRLVERVEVDEITLPGSEGQIQILPGHAAMVGTLQAGGFAYHHAGPHTEKGSVFGALSTGFFEVKDDEVQLMVETLELKSEIDVDRAKKAQAAAEKTLLESDLDEHQFRKYELKLQRALIRQQVAGHS